jgi:hypothetical protein
MKKIPCLLTEAQLRPRTALNEQRPQRGLFGNPFDATIWQRVNYPSLIDDFFAKNLPIAL